MFVPNSTNVYVNPNFHAIMNAGLNTNGVQDPVVVDSTNGMALRVVMKGLRTMPMLSCDFCKLPISAGRPRLHCTLCEDYDLCAFCAMNGLANKPHSPDHQMHMFHSSGVPKDPFQTITSDHVSPLSNSHRGPSTFWSTLVDPTTLRPTECFHDLMHTLFNYLATDGTDYFANSDFAQHYLTANRIYGLNENLDTFHGDLEGNMTNNMRDLAWLPDTFSSFQRAQGHGPEEDIFQSAFKKAATRNNSLGFVPSESDDDGNDPNLPANEALLKHYVTFTTHFSLVSSYPRAVPCLHFQGFSDLISLDVLTNPSKAHGDLNRLLCAWSIPMWLKLGDIPRTCFPTEPVPGVVKYVEWMRALQTDECRQSTLARVKVNLAFMKAIPLRLTTSEYIEDRKVDPPPMPQRLSRGTLRP